LTRPKVSTDSPGDRESNDSGLGGGRRPLWVLDQSHLIRDFRAFSRLGQQHLSRALRHSTLEPEMDRKFFAKLSG
jgi:hypothetical protein